MRIRGKARRREVRVAATEAAKAFGHLVDRVREERATYVIERGGKPVAQITAIEQRSFTFGALKAIVAALPRADADYLTMLERVASARNKPKVRSNPWAR
ncbi:MAG TPA: hypothetical protein VFV95_14930 [Vicinamibacterales bacterium]|nr:hypothetical protein [Vicinamibacterales bacterium]